MLFKKDTNRNHVVRMMYDDDRATGYPGLTLVVTASKNGAAFGSIAPTQTDLGDGYYNLALTSTHTNTLGDFALNCTSVGAIMAGPEIHQVVVMLPGEDFNTVMTESYAALHAAPTPAQALLMIMQHLCEMGILSTTLTVNRLDGTTPAAAFDLDDASTPSAITRSS